MDNGRWTRDGSLVVSSLRLFETSPWTTSTRVDDGLGDLRGRNECALC